MSSPQRGVPGVDADRPAEIPAPGVAFFGFLSVFPAVVAAVLAYGLVADPAQIRNQTGELVSAPRQARSTSSSRATPRAVWAAQRAVTSGPCGNRR